ncbi:imidazole glycerol phosphate synthase subunit HisH [Sphingomonas sp. BIUV-7]|uniref:Imidazole glycerol phosphate synthase subunit HisH n=1 Tax=Sphingomonas natans TaxID=3063330 RepID=A0ABT8Y957_9SPHN|nr:imidazole glycerol phosphate synthase subunit HisH [Sphingomonas sp. BIUV-7]MDO6414876.1 imidazole glycerol phosphate synthase subunit HisH [Sphingomonas sp. BIUV-7]
MASRGAASDRLALIDYGAGNLHSVENALRAAGAGNILVTADPAVAAAADRIVLPGVGAFANCMGALSAIPGMVEALDEAVIRNARPFLGICVGMQLMATAGEEFGRHEGLGWIPGTVAKMDSPNESIRIPHMGWNDVRIERDHPLIESGEAYFLHSFAFHTDDPADLLATTEHGGAITAAVGRANMLGVQFHPEKSQAYGLGFLARFLEWQP